jgi:hypothetical protein
VFCSISSQGLMLVLVLQQTRALEKPLPESWKLSIARKIENNLLAKVDTHTQLVHPQLSNSIMDLCVYILIWVMFSI